MSACYHSTLKSRLSKPNGKQKIGDTEHWGGEGNGKAYVKPVDRFTPARKAETVKVVSIVVQEGGRKTVAHSEQHQRHNA